MISVLCWGWKLTECWFKKYLYDTQFTDKSNLLITMKSLSISIFIHTHTRFSWYPMSTFHSITMMWVVYIAVFRRWSHESQKHMTLFFSFLFFPVSDKNRVICATQQKFGIGKECGWDSKRSTQKDAKATKAKL